MLIEIESINVFFKLLLLIPTNFNFVAYLSLLTLKSSLFLCNLLSLFQAQSAIVFGQTTSSYSLNFWVVYQLLNALLILYSSLVMLFTCGVVFHPLKFKVELKVCFLKLLHLCLKVIYLLEVLQFFQLKFCKLLYLGLSVVGADIVGCGGAGHHVFLFLYLIMINILLFARPFEPDELSNLVVQIWSKCVTLCGYYYNKQLHTPLLKTVSIF